MQNLETYNPNIVPAVEKSNAELQAELALAQEHIQDLKQTTDLMAEQLSFAAHQIRGPLGAMSGYVSMIKQGDFCEIPKGLEEPLTIIDKSILTLIRTVNDFLDVSQLEQGEMRYYRKDFDLVPLVTDVINEMKNTIETNGLELRLNISPEALTVHGDKTKLKHVLSNLVDNASKYTKEGFIEITVKKQDSKVYFIVKDSGVGIKAETMPLLFRKFSRDKEANSANIHGTGLGLYVAKKMVEAQNGRVWAESEGEGKGSQFYVELDLVKQVDKI